MNPLPNLPKLSFHTNVSSAEKAKVLTDPNKTFTLVYWEIASVGSTAREMLAAYCPKWQWKHEAVVIHFAMNVAYMNLMTDLSILTAFILSLASG